MGNVRLGLLSLDVLAKKVAANPTVQKHLTPKPEFQSMLNNAIAYVGSNGEQKAKLEGPQTKQRLGSSGRFMCFIGGRKGSSTGALRSVWMLDRVTEEWFKVAKLNSKRKQVAASQLGRRVYAAGGWNGKQYIRSLESYDPAKGYWSVEAPMSTPRGSFGMSELYGHLYAVGGFDGHHHLDSVERYNSSADSWEAVSALNTARSGVRTVTCGGHLYAVGGYDGKKVLSTVERFDPKTGEWKQVKDLNVPRRDLSVEVWNGSIFAVGGYDGTSDLSSVEVYNPKKNEWKLMEKSMERARSGASLLAGKKLIAFGGYDGSKYVAMGAQYPSTLNPNPVPKTGISRPSRPTIRKPKAGTSGPSLRCHAGWPTLVERSCRRKDRSIAETEEH